MGDWEKFNEMLLPTQKLFYSNLTMESIADADYKHAKRVWEDFELQNLGQYHGLYEQVIPCYLQTYSKVSEISAEIFMN